MKIKISRKFIGENQRVYIIGEIASAHEGKISILKKLIKAGSKTGVDALKVQIFKADELVAKSHPKHKSFHEIELTEEEWKEAFSYAKELNVKLIADVFDLPSLNIAKKLGAIAFKIHSTNLTNPYMLKAVAKKKKPIFLGVGGSTLNEIGYAISEIRKNGNSKIILMHGFQGNPTKIENTNLKAIKTLREKFNLPVGISDHVDADSELAFIVPLVAIGFGACVIEKHFTLDRSKKGRDYYSSLNPKELERFVKLVREVERAIGTGKIVLSKQEKGYRKIMKKSIVAREDIDKNEKITLKKIAFKRAMHGLSPKDANRVIGKRAKKKIKKDQPITLGLVR